MTPPHGLGQLCAQYGDPAKYVGPDGHLTMAWQMNMVLVPFPEPLALAWDASVMAKAARVHKLIAPEVAALFHAWDEEGVWHTLSSYGGGYADRAQRGSTTKRSVHSWGLALDFDPVRLARGITVAPVPKWVEIAEARGWRWGGRFHVPDGQHIQFVEGY